MKISYFLIPAFILFGCMPQASAVTATGNIQGTASDSPLTGTINLSETPEGLQISVEIQNAPEGSHGIHIHEGTSCADLGNAAGGHFNPDKVKHGSIVKDGFAGAHPGDLGNIEIGPDGNGHLELTVKGLSLSSGEYNVAGKAVILHEKTDDFGQPTGNAGGRIGCGIITAKA